MKNFFYLACLPLVVLIAAGCSSPSSSNETETLTKFQVTLTAVPSEGGSVSPAGGQYDEGESLDISATPSAGWRFVRWEGDYSGNNSTAIISVNSDKNIDAIFEKKTYSLTVNTSGEGTVDEQIVTAKSTDYESGTVVELTANPDEGWQFVEWQGDLTGTANPQQITIDEPKEVTAVFESESYTVSVTVTGQGTVTKNPDQSSYEHGSTVELTANPDNGWQFVEWQGDVSGSSNPIPVTVKATIKVNALFSEQTTSSSFYLDTNGVTVKCEDANVGEIGVVNGITYTKRTSNQITPANAETTCTSEITSMAYMFSNASSFNGDISSWDVSSVTQMIGMFDGASSFNGDLSSWDVSKVTNMQGMFSQASSFNRNLSSWDVSSATSMRYMFSRASSFNGDISSWDVSNVTGMNYMFWLAESFNGDISDWNVSSVTTMNRMFNDASSFNADLSSWDVSNVTDMRSMFSGASSFNADISSWDVSSVTIVDFMFFGASSFNADLSNWNLSGVTEMNGLFRDASSFNADLSSWDVSNVTKMERMFFGASSFNGDLSSWDVSSVTAMSYMFFGATSFNGDLSSWDVSSAIEMQSMFAGAELFNGDLSNWDVSAVTDMGAMFSNAGSFNGDISSWDVSSVTKMDQKFENATIFNQDLSGWCVTNITSEPVDFSTDSPLQESFKPVWGTCPGS